MITWTQRTRRAQRTTESQTQTQTKVKGFISTTILLTVRTYIHIITDNTPALAEDNVDTQGKLQYTANNRRHEMNHNYLGPEDLSNSVFTDVETAVTRALQLISSGTHDLGPVVINHDDSCDVEERKIARFVAHGCTGKHGKGKTPRHTQFTASQYRHQRDECRELTRDELDLVVMGQLQALTKRDSLTQKEKATNTERLQTSTVYQFGGHRICYTTFCSCIAVGRASWMQSARAGWRMDYDHGDMPTQLHAMRRSCPMLRMWSESSVAMLRAMPFFSLAASPATRGMTPSSSHPLSQRRRYGSSMSSRQLKGRAQKQSATLSSVVSGGSSPRMSSSQSRYPTCAGHAREQQYDDAGP